MSRVESIRFLDDDALKKSGYFDGHGPWLAFYASLFLQLLLVPVGFYLLLYHSIQLLTDNANQTGNEQVMETNAAGSGGAHDIRAVLNSTYQAMSIPMFGQQKFDADTNLSVILLVAKQIGNVVCQSLGSKAKKVLVKRGWKQGRKMGIRAIVNPRKVWKQARKMITWLRRVKYLAPLVAASNKFRENLCDLLKKYRQRREAILAMKIRKILWKKMSQEERQAKAARGIQAMYRSYRVRKARWALALMQCHRDELAAIRVQIVLRQMLQRARARIRRKRAELKELEAREQSVVRRERGIMMSPVERKRLYELQDELKLSKSALIDRR